MKAISSNESQVLKDILQAPASKLPLVGSLVQGRTGKITGRDGFETKKGHITVLDLCDLDLKSLPDSIGELSSLQYLYCDRNQLTTLPDSIGNLRNLRGLYLLNNAQLSTLPSTIGRLKNLRELDLRNTSLSTLHPSIGDLEQLVELYLNETQLSSLPQTMSQLKNLKILDLRGNPNLNPDSQYWDRHRLKEFLGKLQETI